MKKRLCDRCGKVIPSSFLTKGTAFVSLDQGTIDLCPGCAPALVRFLNRYTKQPRGLERSPKSARRRPAEMIRGR